MSENLSTAHAHAQQITNFNDMVEYQRKLIHEQSEQILRLKEDRKPKKTDEDLVEMMCKAAWDIDMPKSWESFTAAYLEQYRNRMRAALAVVREAGK